MRLESLGVPRDLVMEHAYLVSLEVRPIALVAFLFLDEKDRMSGALSELQRYATDWDNLISFVIPWESHERAIAGYATEHWPIDLLKWSFANAPERYCDYVLGLLLGYSPRAIAKYAG